MGVLLYVVVRVEGVYDVVKYEELVWVMIVCFKFFEYLVEFSKIVIEDDFVDFFCGFVRIDEEWMEVIGLFYLLKDRNNVNDDGGENNDNYILDFNDENFFIFSIDVEDSRVWFGIYVVFLCLDGDYVGV